MVLNSCSNFSFDSIESGEADQGMEGSLSLIDNQFAVEFFFKVQNISESDFR